MQMTHWELYRRLHRGTPGDEDFYRRAIGGARSVLELGCGWGRLTRALLDEARTITGLDRDAQFLAWGRREVPTAEFLDGDMTDFDLGRRFERIIIPYNAVYCTGGALGFTNCLRCIKRHLEPEGEVWLDCYPVDDFHEAALAEEIPPDDDEPVLHFEEHGRSFAVIEKTQLTPERQRLTVTYNIQDESDSLVEQSELVHDYLLSEDLLQAALSSGFFPSVLAGGFDGSPLDENATQLVLGLVQADS